MSAGSNNAATIEKIFDQMALEDRETERKNQIISGLVEDSARPHVDENAVASTRATVVLRSDVEKEDEAILLGKHDDDYIPQQTRPIRPTQQSQSESHNTDTSSMTKPTSTPAKPRSAWSSFVYSIQKFADSVVAAATAPSDSFNDARTHRPRRAVQRLSRKRTDDIISLVYEVFAYLDKDKDGKVTKDEAWVFVCEMCRKARDVIPSEEWDLDTWIAMRDDFEDILVAYPTYHMPSDGFAHALCEIDMDDHTLSFMLPIMLDMLK